MRTNLRCAFEAAANGEPIIAAVIGKHYDTMWGDDDDPPPYQNKVISWKEAARILDYTYDSGYGGADCHAVYAWTATSLLAVAEYDGSTGVSVLPRNPQDCEPEYL